MISSSHLSISGVAVQNQDVAVARRAAGIGHVTVTVVALEAPKVGAVVKVVHIGQDRWTFVGFLLTQEVVVLEALEGAA